MAVAVYIGDEVSAAGYRLAGLRVHVPQMEDVLETIEHALRDAPLVLLGADLVSHLPSMELDRLLSGVSPAVVVVPDIRGRTPLPDLAHRLREQLGVLE